MDRPARLITINLPSLYITTDPRIWVVESEDMECWHLFANTTGNRMHLSPSPSIHPSSHPGPQKRKQMDGVEKYGSRSVIGRTRLEDRWHPSISNFLCLSRARSQSRIFKPPNEKNNHQVSIYRAEPASPRLFL